MNRILKQFFIGTIPLWLGVVLNSVLRVLPIPVYFFSLCFLVFWCWMCCKACVSWESIWKQALAFSSFGFLMLVLVLIQELILGHYWVSYFGLATQMYFMPGLSFFAVLMSPFMEILTPWPVYVVEMIGLFLAALIGCRWKQKKEKA